MRTCEVVWVEDGRLPVGRDWMMVSPAPDAAVFFVERSANICVGTRAVMREALDSLVPAQRAAQVA